MAKFIGRDARYLERPADGRDILFETQYADAANALARGLITHLFHFDARNRADNLFGEEFPLVTVEDENGKVLWHYGVKQVERFDIVREEVGSLVGG